MKADIEKIIIEGEQKQYLAGELDSIKMTGSNSSEIVGFGPHLLLLQCQFTKK